MVLDKLGSSLKETMKKISGSLFVDDTLINQLVKDIQRSLLQSDVNVKLALEIGQNIKKRIKEEETPSGLSKKDHLTHIVYEELAKLLGGEPKPLSTAESKPYIIMLVGLFGNGKTTTAGKLGKYFQKRGNSVALLSTDTWRPAAYEQLKQTGDNLDIPVFGDPKEKDPVSIYNAFKEDTKKYDILIVDSAGRDALNDELVEEITKLRKAVEANQVFLVMAADIGQAAQKQAQTFHDTCDVTGVIITKMDGTAKGGGALAACSITGAPVRYIGVGERSEDFEEFDAKRFVGRMLGMGDMQALLEKTQDAFDQKDVETITKRMIKGEFTLIDLYDQMQSLKKMGSISKLMNLIPGMGNMQIPKDALNVQEEKMVQWKYLMDSCTQQELEEPEIITGSRIERIAYGAGSDEQEVRDLLKQYKQAKKMMKMFKGGSPKNEKQMMQMMQKMGGAKGMGGLLKR